MGELPKRVLFALLAVLLVVFLFGPSVRKRDANVAGTLKLRVHIVSEANAELSRLHVELLPALGEMSDAEAWTDAQGLAEFDIAEPERFRLRVSGASIETVVSSPFQITRSDALHDEYIRVRASEPVAKIPSIGDESVSVTELPVPKEPRSEFDKGLKALRENDVKSAKAHFENAIRIYPSYDDAYANLGLALQQSGDVPAAKIALEKALQLNQRNPVASRGLARLLAIDKNWPRAETLLKTSLRIEPTDASALTLLAIAQVQQGEFDDAIATGHRAHATEHKNYPLCHIATAEAYEGKKQAREAVAEYRRYLAEDPNGRYAALANSKVAALSH